MKIPYKVVLKVATDRGYSGDDKTAKALKTWLIDNQIEAKTSDGDRVDWAKAMVVDQPDDMTVVVQWTEEPMEDEAEETEAVARSVSNDERNKIKAEVERELLANGRVKLDRPGDVRVGKSGAERDYESRRKRGVASFSDYGTALQYATWLHAKANRAVGNVDRAEKAHAELAKIASHVDTRKTLAGNRVSTGGALVPEQYEADLINLVQTYGVARQICNVVPMTSDTLVLPRASGTHTLYYPEEGSAGTASDQSWSNVQVVAKTGVAISKVSRQILDDAAIPIADHVAREQARRIAYTEDNTLINGNGSIAAGYIPRVKGLLASVGTLAASGCCVSGGGTILAHGISGVTKVVGTAQNYESVSRQVFLCSNFAKANILYRLAAAMGGVTMQEFEGRMINAVGGYPIFTTEVMNKTNSTGSSTVDLIFGDFTQAVVIGDRLAPEVSISDQRYWDEFNIGIRTAVRHGMAVYPDVTQASVGPLAFLYQV
jgi:HK97 family phage major capsid protein